MSFDEYTAQLLRQIEGWKLANEQLVGMNSQLEDKLKTTLAELAAEEAHSAELSRQLQERTLRIARLQ